MAGYLKQLPVVRVREQRRKRRNRRLAALGIVLICAGVYYSYQYRIWEWVDKWQM